MISVTFPSAVDVTKTEKLNNLTQYYKVGCLQFRLSTLNTAILSPFNFTYIIIILKFLMFFNEAEFNDNYIIPKILLY